MIHDDHGYGYTTGYSDGWEDAEAGRGSRLLALVTGAIGGMLFAAIIYGIAHVVA